MVGSLQSLMDLEGHVRVAVLQRTAGRKDAEYTHLFYDQQMPLVTATRSSGANAATSSPVAASTEATRSTHSKESGVEERLPELEIEVAELKRMVGTLVAENRD